MVLLHLDLVHGIGTLNLVYYVEIRVELGLVEAEAYCLTVLQVEVEILNLHLLH